jgi:hypothetical protein
MTCSFCGEPLLTPLERTRGVCASCHLLSRQPGSQRESKQVAAVPSSQDPPAEILEGRIAPPTPLSHQSPAQDDVRGRDSNDSNEAEETGLSR